MSLLLILFEITKIKSNTNAQAEAITPITATLLFPEMGLCQSIWKRLNMNIAVASIIKIESRIFIILIFLYELTDVRGE